MEKELPRLQKTLAAAGVASRRACEALIAEGRVTVNGKIVREMGLKVEPDTDDIRVDGQPIRKQEKQKPLYIMLNKPIGYTSTVSDPHAERTVLELMLQIEERIYPVGRLDVDSEGMLLLTNDGEFANRLTHPRYHVPKLYRVRARGFVGRAAATRLAEGVELEDGKTAPTEVRFIEYDTATQSTIIEITLYEGRNRQVRRMFDQVGHPVRQLTRIGFGTLRLQALNPGTWRKLRPEEVEALLALAQPTATPPKSARRPKSTAPYRPRNTGREEEKRRSGEEETGQPERSANVTGSFMPPVTKAMPDAKPARGGKSAPNVQPAFVPKPITHAKPASSDKPFVPRGKSSGSRPAPPAGSRPVAWNKSAADNPAVSRPAFGAGNPRFADPLNNPLLKARPAKFKSARPATAQEQAGSANDTPKAQGKRQKAKGPVDFSSNSTAGRKAGLPFQPRPKQGHRAFGRAKP